MAMAVLDIIAGTGMIMQDDIWGTIDEQLHEHSPELGDELVPMVRDLTPILTGALISDITYEAYPDPAGFDMGESDLVLVYAEDIAQQAFWHRVYVLFQEGGALGLPTYTNAPHEMFYKTATEDGLAATYLWAEKWIGYAAFLCVGGAGVPFRGPIPTAPVRP